METSWYARGKYDAQTLTCTCVTCTSMVQAGQRFQKILTAFAVSGGRIEVTDMELAGFLARDRRGSFAGKYRMMCPWCPEQAPLVSDWSNHIKLSHSACVEHFGVKHECRTGCPYHPDTAHPSVQHPQPSSGSFGLWNLEYSPASWDKSLVTTEVEIVPPPPPPIWQVNLEPWRGVSAEDLKRRETKRLRVVEEIVRTGDWSLIPEMQKYVAPPGMLVAEDIRAMQAPPVPAKPSRLSLAGLRGLDRRTTENLVLLMLVIVIMVVLFV
jgi:hypothetical protein